MIGGRLRTLLRVATGLMMFVALVGAPAGVWRWAVGHWPASTEWRRVWRSGRADADTVLAVGAVLFTVLWLWFALSVLSEVVVLVRADRSNRRSAPGGAGWSRRLVRFVLVSATVATASSVPVGGGGRVAQVHASTVEVGPPLDVQAQDDRSSTGPFLAGFGSAFALAVSVLRLIGERRRAALRASVMGDRVVVPSLAQMRAELQLRSSACTAPIDRVDLAVRSVSRHVAAVGSGVVAVLSSPRTVTVVLRGLPGPAPSPWTETPLSSGREPLVAWRLGDDVPDDYLVAMAGMTLPPCPALVHLGSAGGGLAGHLFVDVEAVGALWLSTPHATAIARHVAAQLATSLRPGSGRLIVVGVTCGVTGELPVVEAATTDAALATAARSTVRVASEVDATGSTTFALRALGMGEPWEPTVVVTSVAPSLPIPPQGGRGVGLVAPTVGGRWDAQGWYLRATSSGHVLEPLGLQVTPVGLSADDVAELTGLVGAAEGPLEHLAPVVPLIAPTAPYLEPPWRVMVRVLGPLQVTSSDGQTAVFPRRKVLELLVWLTQHRARPTRSAARAALWEVDVSDATFLNVLSELRRRLSECAGSPDVSDWVGRSAGDVLPLHESVVTDDDIVARRLAASRGLPPTEAVEVLRPAVELIVGVPFGGTDYLWVDAEGTMSGVVVRAVTAAAELARHHLALGDLEGVFWSTGQGLKVLPGHEELVALRMRAHAAAGDGAGVRHEWSRYLAALAADAWSAAEPSPKLLRLRAELLSARPEEGALG